MKRSTLAQIHRVYIHTFIQEVGQRDRLVTLGGNMEHVDALSVLGMNVSAMLDKEPDKTHVSMESCEVQSRKAVVST